MLVYVSDRKYTRPVLTLSGPSGVGKTTLAKWLEAERGFKRVRPFTTRSPRLGEDLERSYKFVPRGEVRSYIRENRAAVVFFFFGNFYGFLWEDILAERERDLVFEVYTKAIPHFRKVFTNAISIFLKPISSHFLLRRMEIRGDASLAIQRRLSQAYEEILFCEQNPLLFNAVLSVLEKTATTELSSEIIDLFSSLRRG